MECCPKMANSASTFESAELKSSNGTFSYVDIIDE